MNVLSLFDGMSCGQVALQRANIKYDNYFASEIDKNAIKITQHNFPDTIQLGSVVDINSSTLPKINLLIGGSPCQSFSRAGKGEKFNGSSKLFFEYLRLLKETKPDYFLLENVLMDKHCERKISDLIGINPIYIDSADFCAQTRKRLYWTNIPFHLYEKKNETLQKIINSGFIDRSKSYCIDASYVRNSNPYGYLVKSRGTIVFNDFEDYKFLSQLRCEELLEKNIINSKLWRKLDRNELEKLQTVPIDYTSIVGYNLACHAIGNGWTVDVITHIFKGIVDNNIQSLDNFF